MRVGCIARHISGQLHGILWTAQGLLWATRIQYRGGGSQCSGEACAVDHRPPAGHDVVAQLLRGQALVLGNLINAVLEVGEADLGARLKMTEGGMKVDGSGSEG